MRLPANRTKTAAIYELKITLEGVRPSIWRRVRVPAGIRLGDFHTVIQIAMGWTDSHLHEFIKDGNKWTLLDSEEDAYSKKLDERAFRLHELLIRAGDKLQYVYDFGDDWKHKVVLEKILPESGGPQRPSCVGGKRTGPPEDCGGIYGFVEMEAEEEEEEYAFSVGAVDALLAQERWPADSMG
jgi:hypothetical protein